RPPPQRLIHLSDILTLLFRVAITILLMVGRRLDRCWRKSRIAARILLREEQGRLTLRDVRIGRMLAKDPGVTNRLIDQALYGFSGRKYRLAVSRRTTLG
ncbi:MAG TPA: hypothetical protein VK633_07575, partial [Verrucomicrobiae bacterium]|nr:hypothetical protein [Verrucomicrobiae bacterium]